MAFDAHTNFGYGTVATPPSPPESGTSLTVAAGTGALFPTPPPFNAVVWPAGERPAKANAEIVRVTAIPATDTLTIVREQEGTSARAIQVGDQIRAWITNKTLTDIESASEGHEAAIATEKARAEAAEKAAQGAAEAASIAVGQRGASNGVAKLEGGRIPVAELPSSALILEPKELGEVEGVTKLTGSEGTLFYAKLKGATEFEVVPSHEPWIAELLLTPGKYMWKIKGASWVGSEPEFGEGRLILTIVCVKGEVLLSAGPEGRRGEAGSNGSTIRNGTSAPEESLGANGDFYIKTEGGVAKEIYGPKAAGKWPAGVALKGEKGETGKEGPEGSGSPAAFLKLVTPIYSPSPLPTSEGTAGASKFHAIFARVVIPRTGVLHDLSVYNGATSVGKHRVSVWDTGAKKAKAYRLLWQGEEVEHGSEKAWQKMGDPALAVTAGEVLLLAVMNNETTHKYGALPALLNTSTSELPEGFLATEGETLPKICGGHTFAELNYGTPGTTELAEASLEKGGSAILIIARIA